MASTAARNRANMKYVSKAYDRIALYTKKGNREILKSYTEEKGTTINALINQLLADNVPGYIPFD